MKKLWKSYEKVNIAKVVGTDSITIPFLTDIVKVNEINKERNYNNNITNITLEGYNFVNL